MKKSELIAAIREAQAEWETQLARLAENQADQPGVCGKWSIKDIQAHITWFEREMVGMLQARALVGSPLWNLPPDERNHAIFQQNNNRTYSDVCTEAQQVFTELLKGVETLSEKELQDPGAFPGMPPDWLPWKIIADNTCDHYAHHLPQVAAWLRGSAA